MTTLYQIECVYTDSWNNFNFECHERTSHFAPEGRTVLFPTILGYIFRVPYSVLFYLKIWGTQGRQFFSRGATHRSPINVFVFNFIFWQEAWSPIHIQWMKVPTPSLIHFTGTSVIFFKFEYHKQKKGVTLGPYIIFFKYNKVNGFAMTLLKFLVRNRKI